MFGLSYIIGSLFYVFRKGNMGGYEIPANTKIKMIKAFIVLLLPVGYWLLLSEHTPERAIEIGIVCIAVLSLHYWLTICMGGELRENIDNADPAKIDRIIRKRIHQSKIIWMVGSGTSMIAALTWTEWTYGTIGLLFACAYFGNGIYWIIKKEAIGKIEFSTIWKVKAIKTMMIMMAPCFVVMGWVATAWSMAEIGILIFMLLGVLELSLSYVLSVMNKKQVLQIVSEDDLEETRKAANKNIFDIKFSAAILTGIFIPLIAALFLPK